MRRSYGCSRIGCVQRASSTEPLHNFGRSGLPPRYRGRSACLCVYRDESLGVGQQRRTLILGPTQAIFVTGAQLATLGSICSTNRASGSFDYATHLLVIDVNHCDPTECCVHAFGLGRRGCGVFPLHNGTERRAGDERDCLAGSIVTESLGNTTTTLLVSPSSDFAESRVAG